MNEKDFARVMGKVEKTPTCWLWGGGWVRNGYGTAEVQGRTRRVHRLFYEHYVGEIPDGWHIHHECGVKACVNPRHLRAISPRHHMQLHKPPSTNPFCPRGHLLEGHNLAQQARKRGGRRCRMCDREKKRELRAK
jgi:hypothetical protein